MLVKLQEFKAFADLRKRLEPLAVAMFSYGKVNGLLTKQDFKRAASQVRFFFFLIPSPRTDFPPIRVFTGKHLTAPPPLGNQVCGVFISDNTVNVIFHVFDTNRDGNISLEEFLQALQKRESDIRQPTTSSGLVGLLSCWLNCTKNCSLPRIH